MANVRRGGEENHQENYLMAFQENNSDGHFNYTTEGAFVIMKLPEIVRKEIIGACVIVFCIALLYEGLKVLREEIVERYQKKKKCDTESNEQTMSIFLWPHILQTFMHIIQMTISYFLMLVFMTYNVWLCLAVALGAGAGYFAFRWKRPFNALEASEHCH